MAAVFPDLREKPGYREIPWLAASAKKTMVFPRETKVEKPKMDQVRIIPAIFAPSSDPGQKKNVMVFQIKQKGELYGLQYVSP